jgi:hypothetical protein
LLSLAHFFRPAHGNRVSSTRVLAYLLDSLVRVSRRDNKHHFVSNLDTCR